MGGIFFESSTGASHTEDFLVDNGGKDNKKKKRRSRRSKQNCSLSACSSASEICTYESRLLGDDTSSNHVVSSGHNQQEIECNVDLRSMPEVHLNKQVADENLKIRPSVTNVIHEEPDTVGPILIARPVDNHARRKVYPPHLSAEAVSKGLEEGGLLSAIFHVNAHNSLEAYCKIDGVQSDVLISGMMAQNRAIEGDTVAIVIDPPSLWPRMKGSNEIPNNPNSLQLHQALVQIGCDSACSTSNMVIQDNGACHENGPVSYGDGFSDNALSRDAYESMNTLEKLCTLVSLLPSKRPTGRVVAVMEKSPRRNNVVGFLSVKQWIYSRESKRRNPRKNKHQADVDDGYILLIPNDPKLTKMMVCVENLPGSIRMFLEAGDLTIETFLVAAEIVDWPDESYIPEASVIQTFGRGSDIDAQIAAILFEHAIDASDFSSEALLCVPKIPWKIPHDELQSRRDLRKSCIFTIDPATASDLDDALSVERLPNGVFRVGVHIADVSYFVLPDTPLDGDARIRSTSVYLLQRKLSMLPPLLSDNLASLNPGVDRLAFSIFWDIDSAGVILDRWIGRTVIHSSCKLSYEHAQEIIDGAFDAKNTKLYGQFEWCDVIKSVKCLHEVSKLLKENRFRSGALSLESPKIGFLFDEEGLPYDTVVTGRKDSNFLVEELMLLANKTAAEVITRAYPSCALLRRHPEPNARKLLEFEAFCGKHGLKLDTSSSVYMHNSLEQIREELKNDSSLFDILMSYAARPMQLASYFCSGDLKHNNGEWCHYALAVPLYTHFTSPLRRYSDIVVHRTLAAVLDVEDNFRKGKRRSRKKFTEREVVNGFFLTGLSVCEEEVESVEAREALGVAAKKYGVFSTENLSVVAAHCNEKKLSSRRVKDAIDRLYMWALLKRKKILYSEARVLGLGPKFMSIYISKLAIEKRIYYDEVEGLKAEWLVATSSLLLNHSIHKRPNRKGSPSKFRPIDETAMIVSPIDLEMEKTNNLEPSVFPLTLHLLSTIPVALHAIGGDDGPLDIVARLYVSSYFH
ncbi:hypothetical protein ABFS82_03G101200 [Erythranthe guttata]